MKIFKSFGILTVSLGLLVGACGDGASVPGGDGGLAVLRSALDGPYHDVWGFQYDIECDNGFTASEVVPLEDESLPPWLDPEAGDDHPFADLLTLIPPGLCKVTATPIQENGKPSADCDPVSAEFEVFPEETTEIVLMSQCAGDPDGAGDIVVGLNDTPIVVDLQLNKFVCVREELPISALAEDINGDEIDYSWQVVTWPEQPGPGSFSLAPSSGETVTFVAGTPGLYEITLTVTDPYGAATSITFPVHVSPAEECAQACDCPEGFDVAPAGDGCLRTEIAEPTIYDTTYQVCKAEYNPNYSRDGAQYPGGLIVENSYWGESYADPDSRLNTVGVWACDPDSVDTGETYVTTLPTGEWIGFAVCLDIPEGGDYLIGLGADNRLRFSLNGNLEFAMLGGSPDNFTWWWINPIQLSSGLNIIELEGYNISQAASFGAEIAGPFPAGSLNTDADMAAADYAGNLIFSTLDQIGINFTLGESSGTQCPEGFALNTCSPAQECIRIQRVDCR